MADEPRYTLTEAAKILAARQCLDGHQDLQEIGTDQGIVAIVCNHCGKKYVAQ